jgi:hypothetical protein
VRAGRAGRARALAVLTSLSTFSLAACGGSGGGDTPPPTGTTPAISLALGSATLSVVQGGAAGPVAVTIGRSGGFTGDVTLTATPSTGLAATPTTATLGSTATTATINVTAPAGTAPGATYSLAVRATGQGVTERTATVTVTVTAAPVTPPPATNIAFAFCGTNAPVWVAYQSGTDAWTRATGTGPTYTLPIAQRGGVAYVRPRTGGGFDTEIVYGTVAELTARGEGTCGTRTVNGSVAGVGPTDQATVSFDGATAVVSGQLPTRTYVLNNTLPGPRDLLGVYRTLNASNRFDIAKLIVRRGLDPANNGTFDVLDFGSAEAVAPASADLTITGLNGEAARAVTSGVHTSRGFLSFPFDLEAATTATTRRYYGLAAAQRQAGDLHMVTVVAPGASSSRGVTSFFADIVDRNVALGPALAPVTFNAAATAPYLRLRAQLASQADYNRLVVANFTQGSTQASLRSVQITASAGYYGGAPATWELAYPEFPAATGFDVNWALKAGVETSADATAYGGAGPLPGTPPTGASEYRLATRTQLFTP